MRRRHYIRTHRLTETCAARLCSETTKREFGERCFPGNAEPSCHYQIHLSVHTDRGIRGAVAYIQCNGCYDEDRRDAGYSGNANIRDHLHICPRHRPTHRLGIKWAHAEQCDRCRADIQRQIPIELTVNYLHKGFDDLTIGLICSMLDCRQPYA